MKKLLILVLIFLATVSFVLAQNTSVVFFDGKDFPENVAYSSWGFTTNPMGLADGYGYTPGTPAIWWETSDWNWQGIQFSLAESADLSSIWDSACVEYKLIAPAGINTLSLYLEDASSIRANYNLAEFDALYDGTWKHYKIPLASFVPDSLFDSTQITTFAIEAAVENETISDEMYFDDVWIGDPEVPVHITIFNGRSLSYGIDFEAWGFSNNDLALAIGEGYTPGTNAIVWETSNWNWQGKRFSFNPQDMTDSWMDDSIKIKIKAPAGINDFFLAWKDAEGRRSKRVLDESVVVWDGEWKSLSVPLADFVFEDEEFDVSQIVSFDIEAAEENNTIPERVLLDDIWTGVPSIDVIPPEIPASVMAIDDPAFPYMNFIMWDDVETETGESYNIYASLYPITDLESSGVFCIATDIGEETTVVPHRIYYPLAEGEISYYYAVNCVDQAGNISAGFTTMDTPFSNIGKQRSIISLDVPQDFVADGYFDDWGDVVPFEMDPENNLYSGTIDDANDFSINCYVAVDDTNLYVGFDVIDDVFSWAEENTVAWWEDEGIEFFIGLYEFHYYHSYFFRGEEPDHRLLFLPDKLEMHNGDIYENETANYYFEALGTRDYVIEAKIPFAEMKFVGDADFIPKEGSMIPFEIFGADADVQNTANEGRLQLGDNPALNPYHGGPQTWTFAWIGEPDLTDIDGNDAGIINKYKLSQNYPNPFNPQTRINYNIPTNSNVELVVYNTLGQKVKTLVNKQQVAGKYIVTFDASNLASGVYFYKIKSKDFTKIKKMVLLK